jgi:heme exporter protein A
MRLIADQVSAMRAGRTVLSGLSFALADGGGLLLTGPNGAGKTTLLRVLAGFLPPSEGEVRLEGAPEGAEPSEQCHFVGHLPQSKAGLTVRENLAFEAAFLGHDGESPVESALGRLGLADLGDIRAGYLSAGQRRRLALARLLVADRPIWLLDEPSVSLDRASTTTLAELIAAHRAKGGIVVAATHVPLGLQDTEELKLGGAVA